MALTPSAQDMLETLHDPRWALPGPVTDVSPIALECMQNGIPGVFVASPSDPEPHGVEVWNDAKAGKYGPIGPYVAPPVTVEQAIGKQTYEIVTYMQNSMIERDPGPDRQMIYSELQAASTQQGYYFSQMPQPWDRPIEASDEVYFDKGLAAYEETIDYLNSQIKGAKLAPFKSSRR